MLIKYLKYVRRLEYPSHWFITDGIRDFFFKRVFGNSTPKWNNTKRVFMCYHDLVEG